MSSLVVLTGITGFIAKRIALDLLEAGYAVRGTLRAARRADEVRDALRPRLRDPAALDRLSFAEADLTRDEGWPEAMAGADALLHTASPFPMASPRDEGDIIRPAVEGTLRVLRAARAAGVGRVVLTSSVAAIEASPRRGAYTEEDWSDPTHPKSSAYYRSKTLAERAAWDFVAEHPGMGLTAINPALVLGQPLDAHYGTSLAL
ncbi:MAG: NAD-dependent epimerase/dehydratase family protein, partial [Roseicyclus sp.]